MISKVVFDTLITDINLTPIDEAIIKHNKELKRLNKILLDVHDIPEEICNLYLKEGYQIFKEDGKYYIKLEDEIGEFFKHFSTYDECINTYFTKRIPHKCVIEYYNKIYLFGISIDESWHNYIGIGDNKHTFCIVSMKRFMNKLG